ncbi:MAG: DUF4493 domain-containing protein [Muribaculaceae bacterium]|nr:DUF4493 domain-containing protein [Muribaculaceae bacterium]
MKYKIFSTLAVATVLMSSCHDNWTPGSKEDGEGQLRMEAIDVTNAENVIKRAGVDVSNFIVTVNDSEGKNIKQWKFAEMPEIVTLPVGEGYTIDVISHNQEKAAWDAPYFKGTSEKFNISKNQLTNAGTVTCKLSNIKVSIRFSEDLKKIMEDDCKVTVIANDEGRLEFNATETRSGYFQALEGSSTLIATFSGTIRGNYEEIRKVYTDVEAGQHRIITYSVKGGDPTIPDESGNIDITDGITIDMSTIDETIEGNVAPDEDIIGGDRPGQEEPEEPDQPDVPDNPDDPKDEFFKFDTQISLTEVNEAVDGNDYSVNIKSVNPMSNLKVKIESNYLTEDFLGSVGLVPEFDLANLSADLEQTLGDPEGFNFPVGDNVRGQNEVTFNLTPFIPLLNLSPTPNDIHKFHLTVIDDKGNEETIILTFISGVE